MPRPALCSLLLSLVLACVGARAQQDQPTPSQRPDVLGWQDTRWGMTAEDLRRTFSEALQTLPPRQIDNTTVVEYVLPQVWLHEASFTVHFQMDPGTRHLTQIVLQWHKTEGSTPRDASFFRLATFLSQQYGAPTAQHDALKFESLVRSRTWTFPTTVIELRYARSRLFNALTITYRPASR